MPQYNVASEFDPAIHDWTMFMDWEEQEVVFTDGDGERIISFASAHELPDDKWKDLARFFIRRGRFEVEVKSNAPL